MKKILTAICLLSLFLFAMSCTSNKQVIKEREEAKRDLGEIYLREGKSSEALREFIQAEEIYPDDPFLQNDLGLAFLAKKKYDIAIGHFNKAIKLKPDYAPARNNLGTVYLSKKDWDTAIECFKKVATDLIYLTPQFPLSNMGWAYYNKKEYMLSEKYYQEALTIDPDFLIAMRGLGRTYTQQGRIKEAIGILEKADKVIQQGLPTLDQGIKPSPLIAKIYFELAQAYMLSYKNKKALDTYDKIIRIFPDTEMAEEAERKKSEF